MKTLLLSAIFGLTSLVAFGQRNNPTESRESGGASQQSSGSDSYQQSGRTESSQQADRLISPSQSPQKTAPAEKQGNNSIKNGSQPQQKAPPEKQINSPLTKEAADTKKKDTLNKAHSTQKQVIETWQCDKCKREFNKPGDYPDDGKCPYDGTVLVRIN